MISQVHSIVKREKRHTLDSEHIGHSDIDTADAQYPSEYVLKHEQSYHSVPHR